MYRVLVLCIVALSTLEAEPQSVAPCSAPSMRHGPSVVSGEVHRVVSTWMLQMRQRGIKSVGVEATFYWNGGIENISVTNLSYYSAVVTLTSGQESRISNTVPSGDSFSRMLADAAGPFVTGELLKLLPASLAKARLPRARGDIVVILYDDPCLSIMSHLGRLVDPDTTPLIKAASRNQPELYALLQSGADVNAHDQKGLTALMAASFSGNVPGVQALIKGGARVNDRDVDGKTALHYASEHSHTADVIPVLVRAGADLNVKSSSTASYLPGATPLIIAASAGNARAVELLLDAGADPNVLTSSRMTALDIARHPPVLTQPGHAAVIQLLERVH